MRLALITLILLASRGYAQVGYRTATHDITVTKNYDGSFDFGDIDCKTEKSSLIGQEIYFPISNGTGGEQWIDYMVTERGTTIRPPAERGQSKKMDDPYYEAIWSIEDRSGNYERRAPVYGHKTYVYQPGVMPYGNSRTVQIRTSRAALGNKTFTILACTDTLIPNSMGSCYISFTLKDEEGAIIHWGVHSHRMNEFPFYFKSRLAAQKNKYVGKRYYLRTDTLLPESSFNILNSKFYHNDRHKEYVCTDFTFIHSEMGGYAMPYIVLKDSTGEEIGVCPRDQARVPRENATIAWYWTGEELDDYVERGLHTLDSLNTIIRLRELVNEKEATDRLKELVRKYGKKKGTMVADGRVELGMTMEMCAVSWGEPESHTKVAAKAGVTETWWYSAAQWLKFKNGLLVAFKE